MSKQLYIGKRIIEPGQRLTDFRGEIATQGQPAPAGAIDYPCPRCDAPPGIPCRLESWGTMTPRQWSRIMDGNWHKARTNQAHRAMTHRGCQR